MNSLSLLLVSAALTASPNGVLLDFTAKWCGPCQQMKPALHRLQRQGYPIKEIDVDQHREMARKFGIKSIPCFVLIVDGREVTRITGATSEQQLQRLVAMIPQRQASEALAQTPRSPAPARSAQEPRTFAPEEPADREPPRSESQPKRRFQFPSIGRNRDPEPQPERQPVAVAATPPVIRAKLGRSHTAAPAATINSPLASTVRIRIRDRKGLINFGSGTVIDSRPGRSVILTCGHVFADMDESCPIEVDLFRGDKAETFVGQALGYERAADVGLIAIPTETPVPASAVAPPDGGTTVGEAVYSIGCGGGELPSRIDGAVTSLNRYKGPDNIECTGMPQVGRSGGGLFNRTGQVVGVCFAADPKDQRGLYCGLRPIHELLDRAQLTHLYRDPEATPPAEVTVAKSDAPAVELTAAVAREPEEAPATAAAPRFAPNAEPMDAVRAMTRNGGEVEVTCIIRPVGDPRAASRVVVINRASEKFLAYLNGEIAQQPQPTALQVSGDEVHTAQTEARPALHTETPQRYRRSAQSRP